MTCSSTRLALLLRTVRDLVLLIFLPAFCKAGGSLVSAVIYRIIFIVWRFTKVFPSTFAWPAFLPAMNNIAGQHVEAAYGRATVTASCCIAK